MLISVIVPIYDVEKYVERCIESILCQTYKKIEIILVDDGSPDNCGAICDTYEKIDKRVKVIHKQNGGLSDARNAGLDVASGDYVLFVDSDDYIDCDLIEMAVPYLQAGYQSVSFGYVSEDEKGSKIDCYTGYLETFFLDTDEKRFLFICNELTDYRIAWSAWSRFYDRRIIETNSLRFENNKRIFAEDLYFSLCYFPYVCKAINLKKSYYHYTVRSDSIMGNDSADCNINRFEKLSVAVKNYYSKHKECSFLFKNYAVVYYKIINYAIETSRALYKSYDIKKYRKNVIVKEIKDYDLFKKYIRIVCKSEKYLVNNYTSDYLRKEKLSIFQYYADGLYFGLWIRNFLNKHCWTVTTE